MPWGENLGEQRTGLRWRACSGGSAENETERRRWGGKVVAAHLIAVFGAADADVGGVGRAQSVEECEQLFLCAGGLGAEVLIVGDVGGGGVGDGNEEGAEGGSGRNAPGCFVEDGCALGLQGHVYVKRLAGAQGLARGPDLIDESLALVVSGVELEGDCAELEKTALEGVAEGAGDGEGSGCGNGGFWETYYRGGRAGHRQNRFGHAGGPIRRRRHAGWRRWWKKGHLHEEGGKEAIIDDAHPVGGGGAAGAVMEMETGIMRAARPRSPETPVERSDVIAPIHWRAEEILKEVERLGRRARTSARANGISGGTGGKEAVAKGVDAFTVDVGEVPSAPALNRLRRVGH